MKNERRPTIVGQSKFFIQALEMLNIYVLWQKKTMLCGLSMPVKHSFFLIIRFQVRKERVCLHSERVPLGTLLLLLDTPQNPLVHRRCTNGVRIYAAGRPLQAEASRRKNIRRRRGSSDISKRSTVFGTP